MPPGFAAPGTALLSPARGQLWLTSDLQTQHRVPTGFGHPGTPQAALQVQQNKFFKFCLPPSALFLLTDWIIVLKVEFLGKSMFEALGRNIKIAFLHQPCRSVSASHLDRTEHAHVRGRGRVREGRRRVKRLNYGTGREHTCRAPCGDGEERCRSEYSLPLKGKRSPMGPFFLD